MSLTGISVVELFNRIGRRARGGGDYTKLSLNGQMDILQAANAGLQRLYNALPTYFKEMSQGFILRPPATLTGIEVTKFSNEVTGVTFTDAQFGCTIVLDGDPVWNQIIGPTTLLNQYNGNASGTVNATVYGDAIYSTVYPFDRVIGNPFFANQALTPLVRSDMIKTNGPEGGWLFSQSVGQPQSWWPQLFGYSQNKAPAWVLKFLPVPDQAYSITVRLSFWAKRLTLADYLENSFLPIQDQFIESAMLPMCTKEFMVSPEYEQRGDEKMLIDNDEKGEAFARKQPGQFASPNNRCFTPVGF